MAAPDIERSLQTAHASLTVIVFVVPGLIGLVFEPAIFLLADRFPRRWFIRGGVAMMAIGAFIAAAAPGPITLAIAIGISYLASGSAVGLAQATLVDRWPDQRGRTLARWTLWSTAGDFAAPLLLAAIALLGASWQAGYGIIGIVLALTCVALCLVRFDGAQSTRTDEPTGPGLLATLRETLRDRALLGWLFGCALCDLLDEILVVFASLHLRIDLGASALWQSAVIGAFMVGGALGLVVLDRLLRVRSERWLLVACCIGCIVTFVPWLAVPTPLLATILIVPVGACSAPLYPLVAAQAYARRPDQSGSVLAASHLFTPLGLALPFLLGVVADHAGTTVALALLVVQPVGLVVLVAATRRQVAP